MNDVDEYQYPLYNIIISKIAPSQQYDYYYIVNIDMLFFKTKENEVSYIDGLQQLVNTSITDDMVSKITNGDALLIFDFGSEIIPISTDDETLYGKINKIFDEKGCAHGVQYWTMYSDPFSLVDKEECKDKDNFIPEKNIIDRQSICDIIFKCTKTKFTHTNSVINFINYKVCYLYGVIII